MAEELHTLLHKARVPGPYVLAAHSLGGYTVRMYASLYPTDVVGMLLVDSVHPDYYNPAKWAKIDSFSSDFQRKLDRIGYAMPFGIPRLMGWCGTDPPELRSMVRAVECQVKPFREIHEEWANFPQDGEQVRSTGSLGNRPLVVLSRDPQKRLWPGLSIDVEKEWDQAHDTMQEQLTHLSSNSSRVIAKGSGHYIQMEQPDLVIEAVHKVVDQCRQR
jgi:pimeloyl-ACP methyl ester carboxylesterase